MKYEQVCIRKGATSRSFVGDALACLRGIVALLTLSPFAWGGMCADVFRDGGTHDYHENATSGLNLGIMSGKSYGSFPASGATLSSSGGDGRGNYFFNGGSISGSCSGWFCTPSYSLNTSGTGTVRVFVRGNVTLNDVSRFNTNSGRTPQNLVLIVDGNLYLKDDVDFQALVYVTGNVIFRQGTVLNLLNPLRYQTSGALTLLGRVQTESGSLLSALLGLGGLLDFTDFATTYRQSAVDGANLEGLCDRGYAIDHFELSWSGPGLTCGPKEIRVKACANADCSSTLDSHTESMTATFQPTGDTVTFPAQTGEITYDLRQTRPATLVVGATPHAPIITDKLARCRIGTGTSGTNCSLVFSDSGLLFDVPDMTANKPVATVLRAVKKDQDTETCVPAFASTSKDISFWASYVSPSSGTRKIAINGAEVAAGVATSQRLAFNANGEAALQVRYSDAGEMKLDARYTGTGDEAGLIMEGNDGFIARPVGLCVQTDKICPAGDSLCTATYVAGRPFQLTVKPVAWQADNDPDLCAGNQGTPNFALNGIGLELIKVAPVAGVDGTLSVQSYNHQATAAAGEGLNTIDLSQSEVGVFKIAATPPQYMGKSISAGETFPLGRFIPDRFEMTVEDPGTLASTCAGAGAAYLGQSFGYEPGDEPRLRIRALNGQGQVTRNYTATPEFRKLTDNNIELIAPTSATNLGADGVPLPLTVNTGPGILENDIAAGEMIYTLSGGDTFKFNKRNGASILMATQVAPFQANIPLQVGVKDGDNVSTPALTMLAPIGNWLRYGRLVMSDAFGSAENSLSIPLHIEYRDVAGFVRNDADTCTSYEVGKFNVLDGDADGDGIGLPDLLAGIADPAPGHASELVIPSPNRNGAALLSYEAPEWLEHSWPHGTDPRATATFGVYRGIDRMIYWREP